MQEGILVAGQRNVDVSKNGVLIHRRNDLAMDVLQEVLSSLSLSGEAINMLALLYGSGHCRDLHQRLVQVEPMTVFRTKWRMAFCASAPQWGKDLVVVDQGDIVSQQIG